MEHVRIEQFLAHLRETHHDMEWVFRNGGCFQLFLMLRALDQRAEPWYCWPEGHVYTKIGSWFYDIRGGRVRPPPETYPMDPNSVAGGHRWKTNAFGRSWSPQSETTVDRSGFATIVSGIRKSVRLRVGSRSWLWPRVSGSIRRMASSLWRG